MGSQRIRHDWVTNTLTQYLTNGKAKREQLTPPTEAKETSSGKQHWLRVTLEGCTEDPQTSHSGWLSTWSTLLGTPSCTPHIHWWTGTDDWAWVERWLCISLQAKGTENRAQWGIPDRRWRVPGLHNLDERGGRNFPGGPGGGHFRSGVLVKDTEAWSSSLENRAARGLSVVLPAKHAHPPTLVAASWLSLGDHHRQCVRSCWSWLWQRTDDPSLDYQGYTWEVYWC